LYPTSGQVYVWRTLKETYNPEWLVPTVKHGRGSVLIWAAISLYFAGPLIIRNCRIIPSDYMDILVNQFRPMVQMLFHNKAVSKMIIRPYIQPEVFSLGVRSMKMHLNISQVSKIARLKYYRTTVVSFREEGEKLLPPSSLKQLEDVRHEKWHNIPLETIQNLYKSIPRRTQAVLQANVGLTLY
jgi:hypothetical protein